MPLGGISRRSDNPENGSLVCRLPITNMFPHAPIPRP
ncbi:hypothetical protein [Mesorhizobium sp.]